MREIDLIPEEYRRKLLFTRWFKTTGLAILLLSLVIVGAFFYLRHSSTAMDTQIKYLQSQREITTTNRQQLEALAKQKKNLQQQLNLLSGLRSGASAEQMFVTIDRALPGPQVWITNWKFRRAGTPVENTTATVNTGYFIVIPHGSKSNKEETWKIETNMKIQGQAVDHKAMSEFVINLTKQPEIEDVRIVNTRQNRVNQVKLVDFNLDIVVSSGSNV